jgi:hypothetical protein
MLFCKLNPDRAMITGFFPTANVPVNTGGFQPVIELWAQQKMVYTQARVTAVCVAEIIIKGIYLFGRV